MDYSGSIELKHWFLLHKLYHGNAKVRYVLREDALLGEFETSNNEDIIARSI